MHKNFLIGLKIWWCWGSGKKNKIKITADRTFFGFSKLFKKTSAQVDAHFEWKFQNFDKKCLVLHVLCPSLVWEKPEGSKPVTTIAVDPLPAGCEMKWNDEIMKWWWKEANFGSLIFMKLLYVIGGTLN